MYLSTNVVVRLWLYTGYRSCSAHMNKKCVRSRNRLMRIPSIRASSVCDIGSCVYARVYAHVPCLAFQQCFDIIAPVACWNRRQESEAFNLGACGGALFTVVPMKCQQCVAVCIAGPFHCYCAAVFFLLWFNAHSHWHGQTCYVAVCAVFERVMSFCWW